jgi:hypothetical protein
MQSTNLHAIGAHGCARASLPERRLSRFHARHQDAVQSLASRHAHLADLAVSFPALLFALAVPRNNFDPEPVIQSAIKGASLKFLSAAVGLPIWLRGLAPETYVRPIGRLPDGALFRRRIANHLPRSPKLAPIWLQAIEEAAVWGNEEAAVWIAREFMRDAKSIKPAKLRLVCLWVWFSGQSHTIGRSLIERTWMPSMRFATALEAAGEWRLNVEVEINLGGKAIEDMWLSAGCVEDLEFLPIATPEEIRQEAKAMGNCLRTYSDKLAHNHARLWSVRRNGRRVATLQINRYHEDPFPRIVQLKEAENKTASVETWRAAQRWLGSQDLPIERRIRPQWGSAPLDRDRWIALWRPY